MPLVPLEPTVFPEDLFTAPPGSVEMRWWVLHSRPRAEKALARHLLASSVPFFLPLYKRSWRSQGRRLTSFLPLFPSYVFLFGEDRERLEALKSRMVVNCLPVVEHERLQSDLARIHQLVLSEAPLAPEDRLEPGSPVEITAGPLSGMLGTVIRRGKNLRLVVHVDFIQRGASVEIESWMIRPLSRVRLAAVEAAD